MPASSGTHDRASNRQDPSTQSNYQQIQSRHLELKLDVNFERQQLVGWVRHEMQIMDETTVKAIFDTKNIKVTGVEVNAVPAEYLFLSEHGILGTPLQVHLCPQSLSRGKKVEVRIHYATSPSASAAQWLPPECTAGGKYPYLFTQSQEIHARSIIPCQDTPAVKATYYCRLTVPNWATGLMSALRREDLETMDGRGHRTHVWEQPITTPSYLIAIAVGELESRDISHRCRIWSEPSVAEASAFEFSQTEDFLKHAEVLAGPYIWTRYDLLVLPPSFPYGGMENPCLTFVTPTLLAGDRSLADVVAHEISHSWSGNSVTNATWEHFWLNEGWTMWLQRKIMCRIHKQPLLFDLDAQWIGWRRLEEDVKLFAAQPELTALCPELDNVDPDDAYSSIPYEKGFCLLYSIEQMVGTSRFEAFAKHYLQTFSNATVTSREFKDLLLENFSQESRLKKLDWNDLLYKPGLPSKPNFDTRLGQTAELLADKWYEGPQKQPSVLKSDAIWANFSTLQKQIFLERLSAKADGQGPVHVPTLETLDAHFHLSSSKNAELRFRWNIVCLQAGANFILSNTIDFVTTQGRMKYTRPLYRELHKSAMGKELAIQTFRRHANFYHPICRKMVAQDLGVDLSDASEHPGPITATQASETGTREGPAATTLANDRPSRANKLAAALIVGLAFAGVVALLIPRTRRR